MLGTIAQAIMEGASFGSYKVDIKKSCYDHEYGAANIAMESADALASIFTDLVYTPNVCAIQATMEGASCVEESSQAAVMEGAVKNAITKIKEFLIKLKEKVKEFFHNVMRYLSGIFGDTEKWLDKYETELKDISAASLKGYKVKVYNYTLDKFKMDSKIKETLLSNAQKTLADMQSTVDSNNDTLTSNGDVKPVSDDNMSDLVDNYRETVADKLVQDKLKSLCGESVEDTGEEFQKALWSLYRNDASGESSKDEVEMSGKINTFISSIKNTFKLINTFDKYQKSTESGYQKAIQFMDKAASNYDKSEKESHQTLYTSNGTESKDGEKVRTHNVTGNGAKYMAELCRVMSSAYSKTQTAENMAVNAVKQAASEQIGAYKSALLGAFGYARKHKKD